MHDLRDPEVEDLHGVLTARLAEDEDVRGLHVAMRDAFSVRERERMRGGLEEEERLARITRRQPTTSFALEDLLERPTLEPLEDHVGHLAPVGRHEHADVARLTDRRRSLGELGEERALLDECVHELLAPVLREVRHRAKDFDRDGPLPDLVLRAVDDRKAAFADDLLDLVLIGDRRTDEIERIRQGHRWGQPIKGATRDPSSWFHSNYGVLAQRKPKP